MAVLRSLRPLAFLLASLACGCVRLVAFEQTVVGAPPPSDELSSSGETLCDPEHAMGRSAGCDSACWIEGDGELECARVTRDGERMQVDASGLRELEITITACASEGRALRIEGPNGASVLVEGRALEVRVPDAQPAVRTEFLPAEGCVDRTLVFQTGRMQMEHTGTRMCSDRLLALDGVWEAELGDALRAVELCFREP